MGGVNLSSLSGQHGACPPRFFQSLAVIKSAFHLLCVDSRQGRIEQIKPPM